MKNLLPTMTIFGLTKDPVVLIEKIFLYFVTSDYSQSVTFYGKIKSFKWIYHKYKDDDDELKTRIKETLSEYYLLYFKDVDVSVGISDGENGTREIGVDVTAVYENDKTYYLSEIIEVAANENINIERYLLR